MPCEKWFRLLGRYRRAVKIYSDAVDGLGASDFSKEWHSAEAALKNCRDARAALLDHEHEHACDAGDLELVLGDQGQSGG